MTDDIQLTAGAYKAHASQKVQPEQYEPFEVNVTVEGSVESVGGLSNGQRKALKARLLAVQKDLQEVVERSCANRIAAEGHADWGVPASDERRDVAFGCPECGFVAESVEDVGLSPGGEVTCPDCGWSGDAGD